MQGKNKPLLRYLEPALKRAMTRQRSVLLLGPRQVGKTTLVRKVLERKTNTMEYQLQNPATRRALEQDPSRLIREVRAAGGTPPVFIDEAQKVPEILDAAQVLLDDHVAQILFTGSSARKLRKAGVNLLPGRIGRMFLDPLLWGELGFIQKSSIPELNMDNVNAHTRYSFDDALIYGSLPALIALAEDDRRDMLTAYTSLYLEEEIRAEAIVRKIGAFSRFLELAAIESGSSPNLTKLSNESGVSEPSIKEFYHILEDTLVVERVEPYIKNARKRILARPRYYFFDIGVRNALARLPLNQHIINAQKGVLFEHTVVLEIARRIRALNREYTLHYWRTAGGAEVDCIIDTGTTVIPIEIKATPSVRLADIKGLRIFLEEYAHVARRGYVITLGHRKEQLTDRIMALPWSFL